MKKVVALLLSLCLLLPGAAFAGESPVQMMTLPEDSTVFSAGFATQVLMLCQSDAAAMAKLGLEEVHRANTDKDALDASHTSGYVVYQGKTQYRGQERALMLVVVNPTTGGEWYSNFDCAPSQDNNTQYAENFYAAAQDIYAGSKDAFEKVENPLVVLTGYSRGAACANLLGMMMNADYGVENVFTYTAATPATVRGEAANTACPNIFNIVNPGDIITHMPLASWGYKRLGTDIVLPANEALAQQVQQGMTALSALAPDIQSYYTVKHNLSGAAAGEYAMEMTAYEMMIGLADVLSGKVDAAAMTGMMTMIPADSPFAQLAQMFLTPADAPNSLIAQHMPNQYAMLFLQWQMQQMMLGK